MASKNTRKPAAPVAATVEPTGVEQPVAAPAPVAPAPVAATKPARASKPAKDPAKVHAAVAKLVTPPLDLVVERQTATPALVCLSQMAQRVADRMHAGQPQADALAAVLAQYTALLNDVAATTDLAAARHGGIVASINTWAATRFPQMRPIGKNIKGKWDALRGQFVTED